MNKLANKFVGYISVRVKTLIKLSERFQTLQPVTIMALSINIRRFRNLIDYKNFYPYDE